MNTRPETPRSLLAIDIGLKTGLAWYREDGRLGWYRSQNFGKVARLRRAVPRLLSELEGLTWLVAEGSRDLCEIWFKVARKRAVGVIAVPAEAWRSRLLLSRDQRSSARAKQAASRTARQIITWSGAPRPTSLRHDAAEAICIGLWGVLRVGWLDTLPPEIGAASRIDRSPARTENRSESAKYSDNNSDFY